MIFFKKQYKFNPDSLSFDEVKLSLKNILVRFSAYFIGSVLVAIIYWLVFIMFFDSPKEKALKREINQLSIQYNLINREMGNVERILEDLQKTDDNLYRTIFGAEPIPSTLRRGGEGGANIYKNLEGYSNSNLVIETTRRLDQLQRKLYLQSKSFDEIIQLAQGKEDMLRSIPAIMPISNRDLTRTASGYGLRMHPIYKIVMFHSGMDFTAPLGTEIYATGDGTVSVVESSQRGFGKHIIINHGYGYTTLYAHLNDFNVRRGQRVSRGDVIGYVGNTGASVANHLHYEVKLNGNNVDPVNYYFEDLTPDEYERMIEIASKTGQSFD
jgi:murein DD-endopeptidase MepM/ murein hydrolase activator NlpD